MPNPTRQRERFWFDGKRRQVRGVFYVLGKRKRFRLASFAEARVLDLDPEGRPTFRTPADADWSLNFLTNAREAHAGHLVKAEAEQGRKRGPRIKAVLDEWYETASAMRAGSSLEIYRLFMRQYLAMVGDHHIGDFSLRKVDTLIRQLHQRGITNETINNRLNNLRTFVRWAHERGLLDTLPKIKLLPTPVKEPRLYTTDQIRAFLQRCSELSRNAPSRPRRWQYRLHLRAAILLMGTGMRSGEACAQRWDLMDLDDGWAIVRHAGQFTTKERREKRPNIAPFALVFLREERSLFPEEVYVLDNGRGQPAFRGHAKLSLPFGRHWKALGLHGVAKPTHSFRAFYATEALRRGANLDTVARQLGHANLSTTQRYISGSDDQKQEVGRLVGLAFESIWDESGTKVEQSTLPSHQVIDRARKTRLPVLTDKF